MEQSWSGLAFAPDGKRLYGRAARVSSVTFNTSIAGTRKAGRKRAGLHPPWGGKGQDRRFVADGLRGRQAALCAQQLGRTSDPRNARRPRGSAPESRGSSNISGTVEERTPCTSRSAAPAWRLSTSAIPQPTIAATLSTDAHPNDIVTTSDIGCSSRAVTPTTSFPSIQTRQRLEVINTAWPKAPAGTPNSLARHPMERCSTSRTPTTTRLR